MDQRMKKTRQSIFDAFIRLLEQNKYTEITIQQILDTANISRSTFYAHFETKVDLLEAICQELFEHIFDTTEGNIEQSLNQKIIHLLGHFRDNRQGISTLFKSEYNSIFLLFLRGQLMVHIVSPQLSPTLVEKLDVPVSYLQEHIVGCFIETLTWWIKNEMIETPEQVSSYYLKLVLPH